MMTWLKGVLFGEGQRAIEEFGVEELTTKEALQMALDRSDQGPIALFKHSTRCPISASAYHQVARYLEESGGDHIPFYLVKVVEARDISNAVAETLGVKHQSPQLIAVNCKRAYYNVSHGAITARAIQEASVNSSH
jgi:bacillithiol system protein YtxJ